MLFMTWTISLSPDPTTLPNFVARSERMKNGFFTTIEMN
jgi:hypothetical protein